jgi:hypothetical protein
MLSIRTHLDRCDRQQIFRSLDSFSQSIEDAPKQWATRAGYPYSSPVKSNAPNLVFAPTDHWLKPKDLNMIENIRFCIGILGQP